jgi:high-affinity iron transporter
MISLLLSQQNAISQLNTQFRKQSNTQKKNKSSYTPVFKLIKTLYIGVIMVCLLSFYMPQISQLNAGTGLEFIFSIFFSLIYCLIAISFLISRVSNIKEWHYKTHINQQILARRQIIINLATLMLVICVHGSYFSLYVMSFTMSSTWKGTSSSGIVLGVIIGVGICLSIATLLYFILVALDKKSKSKMAGYFLLLFGVGQLMQGLQLLEQVDIISSKEHLWNTNYLIAENSELGYFFTILFGYEATPSAMEIIVYLSAIIVPILMAKLIVYSQSTRVTLMEGTY